MAGKQCGSLLCLVSLLGQPHAGRHQGISTIFTIWWLYFVGVGIKEKLDLKE